jgi:transcriptional regulator with XRE-family HTH domain
MTFQLEVGARLRHLRESRELSRKDVERLSEGMVKESILAMYESGRRRIPTPRLKELADFYSSSLAFLIGESPTPLVDKSQVDVEALLKSDPKYSDEERELLLHVLDIIKAKRRAEGRE